MTTTTKLPQFVSRQEGDGHVVYLPDNGGYLYADAAAYEVLAGLRDGHPVGQLRALVAVRLRRTEDEATDLLTAIVDVLMGRRPRMSGGEGQEPLLCPLSDIVGDSADRCETFGMPL